MKVVVVKVYGEIREYELTTSISQIKRLMENSNDFEIIEYKEGLCEQ